MRRLTPADYHRMPWRNGGGTTTEVLVEPAEGAFLYRVSIADVVSSGPFSLFAGYRRHIVLLEGAGMTLDCGAYGRTALAPLEPHTFSGSWNVAGTLTAGPVRDLNVIVDRARAASTLEILRLTAPLTTTSGDVCVVHVIEGTLNDAGPGDTLVTEAGDSPCELVPRGSAAVALARITRRRPGAQPLSGDAALAIVDAVEALYAGDGPPPRKTLTVEAADGVPRIRLGRLFMECAICGTRQPQSQSRQVPEARRLWVSMHLGCPED